MITRKTLIEIFAVPAFFFSVCAVLAFWPLVFARIKVYLILPLRSRGRAFSGTEAMTDADRERLPKEQRDALDAGVRRLEALGFRLACLSRVFGETGWAAGAVLLNERDGASALVGVTRHERRDLAPFTSESVGFITEFTDDSAITTTNFHTSIFAPDPLCDTVRWPGMRDLDVLYRLHAGRVARDRGARETRLPPRVGVFAHAVFREKQTMWRQVDAGYCRFDADDEVFRRTLKGAFVFYWKLLWPWNQIRATREERKLRQVLRELGMGDPEAYSPNPKDEATPALPYESAPAR